MKRSAPRRRVLLVLCGLWALLTQTVWAARPHIHAQVVSWQDLSAHGSSSCLLCDLGPLSPPLLTAFEAPGLVEVLAARAAPASTVHALQPQTGTTRPRAPPR